MKKLVYLFMALGFIFTACDPMEDIYDDLDASPTKMNDIVGNLEYTFTEDDYTKDLDDGGYFGFSYPNFSSVDQAKELIPNYLSGEYPVWGVTYDENGDILDVSTARMTFDIYAPKKDERSLEVYTVTTDDYDAQGGNVAKYNNFSSSNDIYTFLDWKYPSPANRLLVSLTYKYYSGGVKTLNNGFLYLDGNWEFIQGFTNDEYEMMGESYPNFSSDDEAEAKIPVFLLEKFKYDNKQAGDIEAIMYKVYVGGGVTESYVIYFIFDGSQWSKYTNIVQETVQFGHDGTTWVPDNTIKYTLTQADYELVGNGYYGNFDVRSGKDEESVEARLAKINTILLNNFPDKEEGQKFIVSYNVWTGAPEIWQMKVILEGGEYVLN